MNENMESKAALFAKLVAATGDIQGMAKRGTNDYFKYQYVTAEDVKNTLRGILSQHGLAFFASMDASEQTDTVIRTKSGEKPATHTRAVFTFTFACGETGATWSCRWESEALDDSDKGLNKCATAALKYFLLQTFLIGGGDEPDADGDNIERADAPVPHANGSSSKPKPPRRVDTSQHWTKEAGALARFLEWSGRFGFLEENAVLEILEVATFADFEGSKTDAMARIVAAACDYNVQRIDKLTPEQIGVKEATAFEIITDAKLIMPPQET